MANIEALALLQRPTPTFRGEASATASNSKPGFEFYGKITKDRISKLRGEPPTGMHPGQKLVVASEQQAQALLHGLPLEQITQAVGGGGPNSALGVAHYEGSTPTLYTAMPAGNAETDFASNEMLDELKIGGVNVQFMVFEGNHAISDILIPQGPDTDRIIVVNTAEAPTKAPPSHLPEHGEIVDIYANSMAGVDAAHVLHQVTHRARHMQMRERHDSRSGLYFVTIGSDQWRRIREGEGETIEAVQEAGWTADYAMQNETEWATWINMHGITPSNDRKDFAMQLLDTGVKNALVTRGREGADVVSQDDFTQLPIFEESDGERVARIRDLEARGEVYYAVKSTLGAGDSTEAATAVGIRAGMDFVSSAAIGMVAGADTLNHPDATSGRQSYDYTLLRSRRVTPLRHEPWIKHH